MNSSRHGVQKIAPTADDPRRAAPPDVVVADQNSAEAGLAGGRLRGKHVGMVVFSHYPDDARPRRAINALLEEGMTIDLICLGGKPRHQVLNGLKVTRLGIEKHRGGAFSYFSEYGSFILATAAILAARSVRRRYDLVYVHNMPDVLVASALIPKLLGAKVVLDMHDPMPELITTIFKRPGDSRTVRVAKVLEKWSMARVDLVLAVNMACKTIFSARSCPAQKIGVVMNTPDEQIFKFTRPQPVSGISRKPLVLMYHGSLLERNGLDLAVDALAIARQRVPDVELRVYGGSTPFFQRVMAAARTKGVDSAIQYFGPKSHEEIVHAIEQCDVGVVPNHRNTFTEINTPTRIFEYLAMGKPVIAPSTPGILDYFSDNSLLLFEAGNSADIAQQIEQVAHNYENAVRVAARGQQVYLQHTWKQERRTLVELISGLFSRAEA